MPSTRCQRHAGFQEGKGRQSPKLVENNKDKKGIFTTFSQKDKGFKNQASRSYFSEPMAALTVFFD